MNRPLRVLLIVTLALLLPAQDPYGIGSPGSGGFVPELSCNAAWMGNLAFGFTVTAGLGAAPVALAISTQTGSSFLGSSQLLISVAPTDLLLATVFPLSGPPGTPGGGSGTLAVPLDVPVTPALAGVLLYAQAVVLDQPMPGSPATTNGLVVELGLPPTVFVSGGSEYYVDVQSQSVIATLPAGPGAADGAAFAGGGRDLYLSRGTTGVVSRTDLAAPVLASGGFFTAPGNGGAYGVGYQRDWNLVWTLSDVTGAGRELVAIDASPVSPTFGQVVYSTTNVLNGDVADRLTLSASGKRAAIVTLLFSQLLVVDTDPTSPSFLNLLAVSSVPSSGGVSFPVTAAISPDDQTVLVHILSFLGSGSELARYEIGSGWVDFNPVFLGLQNIGPFSNPPAPLGQQAWGLRYARSADFAVVAGGGISGVAAGSAGWAGRIDFQPGSPTVWNYTAFAPQTPLTDTLDIALSADDTSLAVVTTSGGPQLLILDAASGVQTAAVPLPGGTPAFVIAYH